jgi:bifunctional non-homologous end joining protein LigD
VDFAFDLLQLNSERLEGVPLEERKARLRTLLGQPQTSSLLHYADHVIGQGDQLFEQARALGLEGIVSKRRDRPYRAGLGQDWVKAKCLRYQTLMIGGFTDQAGSTGTLDALLVGGYDAGGRLIYCGRVGTGFSHAVASDLRARLHQLERRTPPFVPPPAGAPLTG